MEGWPPDLLLFFVTLGFKPLDGRLRFSYKPTRVTFIAPLRFDRHTGLKTQIWNRMWQPQAKFLEQDALFCAYALLSTEQGQELPRLLMFYDIIFLSNGS